MSSLITTTRPVDPEFWDDDKARRKWLNETIGQQFYSNHATQTQSPPAHWQHLVNELKTFIDTQVPIRASVISFYEGIGWQLYDVMERPLRGRTSYHFIYTKIEDELLAIQYKLMFV